MAILEKEVWVGLNRMNINYYENLGYKIPRRLDNKKRLTIPKGTKILVKLSDLQNNSSFKLTRICDECGEKNIISYQNLLVSRPKDNYDLCYKCTRKKIWDVRQKNIEYENTLEHYAKSNNKEFLIKEFSVKNKLNPNKIYKGTKRKFLWNCFKCNSEYEMRVMDKTCFDSGCPYCCGHRVNGTNSLENKNHRLTKEWHPIKNGELKACEVTCGSTKKVWWLGECGHEWRAQISSRNSGRGCPICSESKGEKSIRDFLNKYKIYFIAQKEFEDLIGVGGGLLSFDFYIPKLNLLIEYQGEFHDGSGGDYTRKNLKRQQEHDKRKREYATQNNINLLEIWHWDFEKMGEILRDKVNYNESVIL